MRNFAKDVRTELAYARAEHPGDCRSRHEGYAVLLEEVDEVKDAVWNNHPSVELYAELIQVAAMAQRMAEDLKL